MKRMRVTQIDKMIETLKSIRPIRYEIDQYRQQAIVQLELYADRLDEAEKKTLQLLEEGEDGGEIK